LVHVGGPDRRDRVVMTMYLPNHDVRPTGDEIAEFIDDSPIGDDFAAGTQPMVPPRDGSVDATRITSEGEP
jgi:hypothetical protein